MIGVHSCGWTLALAPDRARFANGHDAVLPSGTREGGANGTGIPDGRRQGETQPARDICKATLISSRDTSTVTATVDLISATPDVIAQEGAELRRKLPRRKTWRPASELAVDLGT